MRSKTPSREPSYWIETLGCPKNQVDSRRMRSAFNRAGFGPSGSPEKADFIVINSCAFIREAQEETIHTIYESLKIKEKTLASGKKSRVILVGCFAQRFSKEVREEIPELDEIVGVGRYEDIPSIISSRFHLSHQTHIYENFIDQYENDKPYAYFRIAQGCSRSCAFCAIPHIRGGLKKYDIPELEKQLEEEKNLRRGVPLREAILVSQDTISQGIDQIEKAVEFFSEQESIEWIRLHYLFPDKRILKLLDIFENYPKLTSYLDIPFQHVSERMLRQMKRPSDTSLFRDILEKWHDIRPRGEVRTSFIIGFPTEEEADIEQMKEFLQRHQIDKLSLFSYSHEEGTPAYQEFEDNVPEHLKVERINHLREFHLNERNKQRSGLVGEVERVLVEKTDSNEMICRRETDSPGIDEVIFVNPASESASAIKTGDFVNVRFKQSMEYDWIGELV